MQPTTERIERGSAGLFCSGAFFLAMLLFYCGERLVNENVTARLVLGGLAAVLIAFAVVVRLRRWKRLGPMAQPVEARILLLYGLGLLALVLYLAQADFVMERLRPLFAEPKSVARYQTVLQVLWMITWALAVIPLLFVEIGYAPMDVRRTVEASRIKRSMLSGLIIAAAVSLVGVLNYIADATNEKSDLSYFKTTRPSASSKRMVENLSEPLEVTLFFPYPNEVLDRVQAYFDELRKSSPRLTVRVIDQVLEPKLAKEFEIGDNGSVLLRRGAQHKDIIVGKDLQRAKLKLKKFDTEFQSAFLKLATQQKVAYLVVGHDERSSLQRDSEQGGGISDLRTVLTHLNYQTKDLGLTQGLASRVPDDATLVVIIGPTKEFLPAEIAALKQYLTDGGKLLAFFDAEPGLAFDELLNPFGLKLLPQPLSTDPPLARRTYTNADRHIIVTNRYGSHPSVSTLSRNSSQLAVVFSGTGYFESVPVAGATNKPQVLFTVHSLPGAWNDLNNNFEFDSGSEKKQVFEIAAAVSLPVATKKPVPPVQPKEKGKGSSDANEMRMVVVADSDIVSDGLLRALGNRYLLLDALKWLGGQEELLGEVSSEEDVRIQHTRKEDQLWFYLTIFAIPALVLGGGFLYTRRRRSRS